MKYILTFEKLGILEELDLIADDVINIFNKTNDNNIIQNFNYLNNNISIRFILDSKMDNDGEFEVVDFYKLIFLIRIKKVDKSILIHELKHLDREIRKGGNKDSYYKLNHIGKFTINNYKHFAKNNSDFISMIFYYIDPNEFESYYNGIYNDLKELLIDIDVEDKRKFIKNYLEKQDIYILYRELYKNGFDISLFFKNNNDVNYLVDEIEKNINYYKNYKHVFIPYYEILISKIKNIFSNFKNEKDLNKNVKDLNKMVMKVVNKNYPKFHRLYSILN